MFDNTSKIVEPRNFLQPCLLLLLRERPGYGYDLVGRLRPFGVVDGDAAGTYRALRSLERKGMVRSEWQTSDAGPARRTYQLTEQGIQGLHTWARALEETRRALDYYLDRHALVSSCDEAQGGTVEERRHAETVQ